MRVSGWWKEKRQRKIPSSKAKTNCLKLNHTLLKIKGSWSRAIAICRSRTDMPPSGLASFLRDLILLTTLDARYIPPRAEWAASTAQRRWPYCMSYHLTSYRISLFTYYNCNIHIIPNSQKPIYWFYRGWFPFCLQGVDIAKVLALQLWMPGQSPWVKDLNLEL